MKLVALSFILLAVGLVCSAAVDLDPHSQLMANVSSVFGWQLAGSQRSLATLEQGCQDIASFGHGHWFDLGLNSTVIAGTFCAAATAGISNITAVALAQIKLASTETFITQLLHTSARIRSPTLNSGRVGRTFCHNRPYDTVWVPLTHEVSIVPDDWTYNTTSKLFGVIYSFSAFTDIERSVMCQQYKYMAQAQLQLGIDTNIVRSYVCAPGNEVTLDLVSARVKMAKLTNLIFQWQLLTVLDAVSDSIKKDYLCNNIDEVELLWKTGATGQILACGGLLPDEDYPSTSQDLFLYRRM
ncbi:hypothetical protein AUEXF2481DRAFT_1106 [Aureobasidium subglaciale EXF-2481]|uniref:Uncharacterized protein n=1 Tax=Aureobasidium subglaciale (strain EXF-2481) TaxID=1043005 RepID=A0A074ZMQ0_AURSE|nr:uncharacterized protein AUEXF2481DRAFT_1106 [Aureobasidium subglaciale EXF-2481]KEQ99611.1 hypothetical protein AUEXF2481DRAFT_1106 [Aureobasidium subglaciale EXF-2481]